MLFNYCVRVFLLNPKKCKNCVSYPLRMPCVPFFLFFKIFLLLLFNIYHHNYILKNNFKIFKLNEARNTIDNLQAKIDVLAKTLEKKRETKKTDFSSNFVPNRIQQNLQTTPCSSTSNLVTSYASSTNNSTPSASPSPVPNELLVALNSNTTTTTSNDNGNFIYKKSTITATIDNIESNVNHVNSNSKYTLDDDNKLRILKDQSLADQETEKENINNNNHLDS